MRKLLKKIIYSRYLLPFANLYFIYSFNLSLVDKLSVSTLMSSLLSTTKKISNQKRKIILFYPDLPSPKYRISQIIFFLGYSMINNPKQKFDFIIKWEDNTFSEKHPILSSLVSQTSSIININCVDISKSYVDQIFRSIFGYGVEIDPLNYDQQCVVKSNLNHKKNAEIISCPISQKSPNLVYNKLINNRIEENMVLDIRVPIFKNSIPLLILYKRSIENRFGGFGNLVSAEIFSVEELLSEEEVRKILLFSEKIGLEYGELDLLRDEDDKKVYIVDVNNTPYSNMLFGKFLNIDQRIIILEKLANSFQKLLI